MGLECLLLTRDSDLLSGIRAKFNELGIEILVRKDAALAVELSKGRHLDDFVIDCDDVQGGKEALSNILGNPANKQSVMVAVLNGGTSVGEAIERGNTGRRRVKAAPNTIQRTNSRCNPRITYYLDALVYPNIPPSLL